MLIAAIPFLIEAYNSWIPLFSHACIISSGHREDLHLADVRLAQEKHTDTGLTDTAADGVGKLPFDESPSGTEALARSSQPASFNWDVQGILVHADTHGGKLQGNVPEPGTIPGCLRLTRQSS